jgi:hypothetical protein
MMGLHVLVISKYVCEDAGVQERDKTRYETGKPPAAAKTGLFSLRRSEWHDSPSCNTLRHE